MLDKCSQHYYDYNHHPLLPTSYWLSVHYSLLITHDSYLYTVLVKVTNNLHVAESKGLFQFSFYWRLHSDRSSISHGVIIHQYREMYFWGSQKVLKFKVKVFDPLISCSWMQWFPLGRVPSDFHCDESLPLKFSVSSEYLLLPRNKRKRSHL